MEQWERMMLQDWLELSEEAGEEDRAGLSFFLKEKLI